MNQGDEGGVFRGSAEYIRSLVAALEGDAESARDWAARADALVIGQRWSRLETHRARGVAALAEGDPSAAVRELGAVWEHTEAEGIYEPGVFPVAPDLVEAALAAGDVKLAERVTHRLAELAEAQEHPWGLASAERCRALVCLATDTGDATSCDDLRSAAAEYERLGLAYDAARTLLSVGRHERRRRKRRLAREALDRSAALFDELGCRGWAEIARSEVARVSGRRPRGAHELTGAEERAAQLAASGMSNKEIAASLFVTPHTVELHLSRAYAKLGVRSRSQLAGALALRTEAAEG